MNRTSNPAFRAFANNADVQLAGVNEAPFTIEGAISKTGILLMLVLATSVAGWIANSPLVTFGSMFLGLFIGILLCFRSSSAPILAPVYALVEGVFVGGISNLLTQNLANSKNAIFANAIPVAVVGTLAALGVMLALYRYRIIRVTDTLRSVIIGATGAVFLVALFWWVGAAFAPNFVNSMAIYGSGPIGIGYCLFVIALACSNFLLDFDFIERMAANRTSRSMEWFAAFGLIVTIIWLYVRILRLLSMLNRR